jgi:hypothetical protein
LEEEESSQEGTAAVSGGTIEEVVVEEKKMEVVSMEGCRGGENQSSSSVERSCVSYYVL